jgi:hypothetical protein
MSVQDDSREIEVRNLFGLTEPAARSRADTDAELLVDGIKVDFELKSTTRGSVTTVRDFSMDHVIKWRHKHWIIGVYDRKGTTLKHCLYGSPAMMSQWIEEKATYIKADVELAQSVPELVNKDTLYQLLGRKETYTYEDASTLHKRQYSKQHYIDKMDVANGYTEDRMLSIMRDRVRYLILRGSTLNNPHIPESYFKGWPKITKNHQQAVILGVKEYLQTLSK